jgi:hypothetical protein
VSAKIDFFMQEVHRHAKNDFGGQSIKPINHFKQNKNKKTKSQNPSSHSHPNCRHPSYG